MVSVRWMTVSQHIAGTLRPGKATNPAAVSPLRGRARIAAAPEFMRALAGRLPQHEEKLMTIAQQLEQIGLGEEKGIKKGEREATLKIARNLLEMEMSQQPVRHLH